MNRIFGSAGSKTPAPTLQDAVTSANARIESLDAKIATINAEFAVYQGKLARMERDAPGRDTPAKRALKKKALEVLRRRRNYESVREQQETQVFNMERVQSTNDNLQNVGATIKALEATNKAMRKQYGKIDIDKIERLQDEMADLMDMSNEIQETLARSYDIPEDIDEADLDAELEALGQEVDYEAELNGTVGVPSFMQEEVPDFIDEPPQTDGKVKEVAG
ncbi:Vacuolar protein-sorting-associated protein 60 [Sporothrix eucalyptigena]|uniref:Vacuolar protein-sorting-associated protein 60 n=1 Tax=Sporothrix eucalyptigena TaxID=1812306 RepID=A0ABP0CMK3_9PEZI